MNSFVKNILLFLIGTSKKVEKYFGSSDFIFSSKRSELPVCYLWESEFPSKYFIIFLLWLFFYFKLILNVNLTEPSESLHRTDRYLRYDTNCWTELLASSDFMVNNVSLIQISFELWKLSLQYGKPFNVIWLLNDAILVPPFVLLSLASKRIYK